MTKRTAIFITAISAAALVAGIVVSCLPAFAGNDTCVASPGGCADITDNSTTNQGGTGVGVGIAGAKAEGGDVYRSGNSKNENTNKNRNDNRSNATAIQGQDQGQIQGQSTAVSINNERGAASSYATGLVTGNDVCMGSTSAGVQALDFGISLGTTWEDDTCKRLKMAQAALVLGNRQGAFEIMCDDDKFRAAMRRAGTLCAVDAPQPVAVTPSTSAPVAQLDEPALATMAPVPN